MQNSPRECAGSFQAQTKWGILEQLFVQCGEGSLLCKTYLVAICEGAIRTVGESFAAAEI